MSDLPREDEVKQVLGEFRAARRHMFQTQYVLDEISKLRGQTIKGEEALAAVNQMLKRMPDVNPPPSVGRGDLPLDENHSWTFRRLGARCQRSGRMSSSGGQLVRSAVENGAPPAD